MPPTIARQIRWPAAALFALVVSAIGFGAWTGFPVFSDAIVPLIAHESGVASIAARHADRPLYGRMVQATVAAFGFGRPAWIVLGLASWGLLAWLTARLFRLLFPERADWSWLPALLVLSPIVVQTQFATVTIAYPGVLPVALVLGAWLTATTRTGARGAAAALALGALAAVLSEYGVAAAFAAVILALGLRERRTALWIGAGAACGAIVFKVTADSSARPDVSADAQLPALAAAPVAALYRWLSGTWHAVVGAYGGAVWHTQLDARSRGSAVIALLGVAGAVLAAIAAARVRDAQPASGVPRRLGFLLLAVAAAILPVAAAGRATVFAADWTGEYETRFLLAALPFASLLIAGAIACGAARWLGAAAAALLAFLCVEASWQGALQARRSERWAEQLGRAVRPLMRSGDGVVIVVGPDDPRRRWGSVLTGKMTASWSDEDARRVWAMARSSATRVFGAREGCRAPETVDLPGEIRWGRRAGPLRSLVWVPDAGDRVGAFEPYCLGARAP